MFENQWSYLFEIVRPNKIYILHTHTAEGCEWVNDPIFSQVELVLINNYSEIQEQIVYLAPQNGTYIQGNISLVDYVHPESCCYVFGPNDSSLQSSEPGDKVYIPTNNDWQYYNWMVGAITFYDRRVKNGAG
jgi:hypothetical protein